MNVKVVPDNGRVHIMERIQVKNKCNNKHNYRHTTQRIAGHATTKNRLIYVDGKLHKLPSSVLSLFRKLDPFKLPLFCAGIKDLVTPKQACDDDSMFNFVERRFGPDIAKFAIGKEGKIAYNIVNV